VTSQRLFIATDFDIKTVATVKTDGHLSMKW